ncbi:MAG: hypothetical protein HZA31_06295 [Opitutae bacterium]|nr:hypothetical protein [Opitutae bacterium]
MSLINEALKKAQRMRSHESTMPSAGTGHATASRGSNPMPVQTLILIASGAAVVVAGLVFATVYWLRQQAAPAHGNPAVAEVKMSPPAATTTPIDAAKPKQLPPSPLKTPEPTPAALIVVPGVKPNADVQPANPATAATPTVTPPKPVTATSTPAPIITLTAPGSEVVIPASITNPSAATSSTAPAAKPTPKPNPDAQAYIDAMRITGIRAAGADSKILLKDRVYRINDIVDRATALRLTEVAADHLAFTDENGIVYKRNF